MKYGEILDMNVYDFLEWIDNTFRLSSEISCIITRDDMDKAAKELLRLSSMYAYISELLSWAKVKTREVKRLGDKTLYEDMVDKRDALDNKAGAIKQSYAGISRAVSIRMDNNAELRMTNSRYST